MSVHIPYLCGQSDHLKQVLVDELINTGKFSESAALDRISNTLLKREIVEHPAEAGDSRTQTRLVL
jgi:hypothetical protein